ncbi:MAG: hypothetical protein Q7T80_08975 [Methanoregula sp.]|nr:hypothetical protein [Methanoregula sp.]
MKTRFIALIFVMQLAICSSGCLSQAPASPIQQTQQIPLSDTLPTPGSTSATVSPGSMALQLSDIPPDYLLRDRTVIAYSEVSQLARDLGWQQGYRASFYRMNREKDDITGILQSISVYPPENIDKVYSIDKEEILSGKNGTTQHEIPFPAIGDQSIAFRETRILDHRELAVYTVIFTKKNVFETITMGGTTTDYEMLKDMARKATDKIQ